MNIELKYKINDIVFYLDNNQVYHSTIVNYEINGQSGFGKPKICYFFRNSPLHHGLEESLCFPTKEELLKSL